MTYFVPVRTDHGPRPVRKRKQTCGTAALFVVKLGSPQRCPCVWTFFVCFSGEINRVVETFLVFRFTSVQFMCREGFFGEKEPLRDKVIYLVTSHDAGLRQARRQ